MVKKSHLLTVESNSSCLMSEHVVFESVEKRGLATVVQTKHHNMITGSDQRWSHGDDDDGDDASTKDEQQLPPKTPILSSLQSWPRAMLSLFDGRGHHHERWSGDDEGGKNAVGTFELQNFSQTPVCFNTSGCCSCHYYDVGIWCVFCNNVTSKQTPPILIVFPPQSSNHNSHIFDTK